MALTSKTSKTVKTSKQPAKQKDLSPLVESLSQKISDLEKKVSSQANVIEALEKK